MFGSARTDRTAARSERRSHRPKGNARGANRAPDRRRRGLLIRRAAHPAIGQHHTADTRLQNAPFCFAEGPDNSLTPRAVLDILVSVRWEEGSQVLLHLLIGGTIG